MKRFIPIFIVIVLIAGSAAAQTPTFSNQAGGIANAFPLNSLTTQRKVQWFIPPNSLGGVGSNSNITVVYFQAGSTATQVYPIINIKLKTGVANTTGLSGVVSGPIEPGMTLVYTAINQTINAITGSWMSFTLQTPWFYNPNLPLIVELEHNATTGTGPSVYQTAITGTANGRQYADYNTAIISGADMIRRLNFGIDVVPACQLGVFASGSNSLAPAICSGNSLTLTTNGISNYSWSTGNTTSSVVVVSPVVTTTYSISATTSLNCTASVAITVTVDPGPPVLSVLSSTNSVCLGDSVTLTASGAYTYTWTNSVSNGQPFAPGITNTYTVQGQNGCGISSAMSTVTVAPLPVSAASSSSIVCAASFATLSASGAGSYTWASSSQTLIGQNVMITPTVAIIFTLTGKSGNCIGTTTISIATKASPTLNISSTNTMLCAGSSVTIAVTGADTYTWIPAISGSSLAIDAPTASILYQVSGTNSLGCISATSQAVVVSPTPNVNVSVSPPVVCPNGTAVVTVSGNSNVYAWNSGPALPSMTVNPATTSIYTVTGSFTTGLGCSTTRTVMATVFQPTMGISPSSTICPGTVITLTAGPASNFSWSSGGAFSSTTVNPVQQAVYSVTATVTSSTSLGCKATNTVLIGVYPEPAVTVVATRTSICKGESTNLTAAGADIYLWSNSTKTTSALTFSNNILTTHTVIVIGTDVNGCNDTAVVFVKVSSCTGIEKFSSMQTLRLYPNPNSGQFTVESEQDIELQIINALGQEIRLLKLDDKNAHQVNVSDLSSGIYYITGKDGGMEIREKVVVSR